MGDGACIENGTTGLHFESAFRGGDDSPDCSVSAGDSPFPADVGQQLSDQQENFNRIIIFRPIQEYFACRHKIDCRFMPSNVENQDRGLDCYLQGK